ncbi:MAG: elongation factor Ts [Candidatus Vogelbacteria bacterium]|nr:elongation factor Ts [Candidatus Vogelbacteria bacterium]
MVTTDQLKKLREMTGISMMQCKKALEDANGDIEGALVYLKKKGIEVAAKKSDRELNSGIVQAYIHSNGGLGSMVELDCETDFVARNEEFKALAYDIAMHVAATNPVHLSSEKISDNVKMDTKSMFADEVALMNKPEEIKAKILQGKIDSYLAEKTLLLQPFVKNPDETVGGLIKSRIQKFGEKIEIRRFVRFSLLDK